MKYEMIPCSEDDTEFIEAFDWNVGFFKKNGYERVTGMLEDYPRGHVMYCMQKSL